MSGSQNSSDQPRGNNRGSGSGPPGPQNATPSHPAGPGGPQGPGQFVPGAPNFQGSPMMPIQQAPLVGQPKRFVSHQEYPNQNQGRNGHRSTASVDGNVANMGEFPPRGMYQGPVPHFQGQPGQNTRGRKFNNRRPPQDFPPAMFPYNPQYGVPMGYPVPMRMDMNPVEPPLFQAPVSVGPIRITNRNDETILPSPHARGPPSVHGSPHVSQHSSPRPAAASPVPVTATPAAAKPKPEGGLRKFQDLIAARLAAEKEKAGSEPKEEPKEVAKETTESKEVDAPKPAESEAKVEPKVEPIVEPKVEPEAKPVAAPVPVAVSETKTEPAKAENTQAAETVPVKAPEPASKAEAEKVASTESAAESAEVAKDIDVKAEPVVEEKDVAKREVSEPSQPETQLETAKAESTVSEDEKTPKPESKATSGTTTPGAASDEATPKASYDQDVSPNTSDNEQEQDEEKAEDEVTDEQLYNQSLQAASRPSPAELEAIKYPPGAMPNTGAREDRHRYSMMFLLQFKSAIPDLDDSKYRNLVQGAARRASSARGGRQMPGMGSMRESRMGRNASLSNLHGRESRMGMGGRNGSKRKGGDRQGSNRGGRDREPPSAPVAPLVRGENAWVPKTLADKPATDQSDDGRIPPEEVQRKVKSLLNKMTLENLPRVADKILEISEQAKQETDGVTVRQIIELTFEKALDESHWSAMYANFCVYMTANISPEIHDQQFNEKDGTPTPGPKLFRRYLLVRCQQEYESDEDSATIDIQQAGVMTDEYYAAVKAKRHALGLIRFIGELYKVGLLGGKIIVMSLEKLSKGEPTEDIVESLSKLLLTVAPRLKDDPNFQFAIGPTMNSLHDWRMRPGFPARLRFMIMDVEDAGKSNWQTKDADKGPKTIAEIHSDANEEQRQAEEEKRLMSRGSGTRGASAARQMRDRGHQQQRQADKMRKREESTPSFRRDPSGTDRQSTPGPETPKEKPKGNMFSHLDHE